ncbi:hypothetical protein A3K55_00145 [Candidatus Shapirobacteria bacterium RBG_13_44_7]|uniref:Uncharacterized protein n=1 Tax=Candidatus Shapirobacteria bacterium RBG_13_44_7 TaxID=1802149 RepID=A0A1F7SEL3_9BACT|nr:MAG: hypothetical protein A3K55_00145 [Candidatus Shapirobacteria bacterium RBG_13_44_7]
MKKVFLGLLISGMVLGGCGGNKAKESVVTKEGQLKTKVGSEYILDTGEELVNITSNKVNLDDYLKKTIRVMGMFSGSTLYVDEIRE